MTSQYMNNLYRDLMSNSPSDSQHPDPAGNGDGADRPGRDEAGSGRLKLGDELLLGSECTGNKQRRIYPAVFLPAGRGDLEYRRQPAEHKHTERGILHLSGARQNGIYVLLEKERFSLQKHKDSRFLFSKDPARLFRGGRDRGL